MSVVSFILAFIVLSMIMTLVKILPGFIRAFIYFTGTIFLVGFSIVAIIAVVEMTLL